MNAYPLITVTLFSGFNEIRVPTNAKLQQIEVDGYEVSLRFEVGTETETQYRRFYVTFNNAPTNYDQGILYLLKTIASENGTSLAMVYEVYPY